MLLSFKRALLGCILIVLSAPVPSKAQTTISFQSIMDLISRDPRFSTLVQMLTAARLMNTLDGDGPFTLFAPTNQAFVVAQVNVTRYLQPVWAVHLNDLLTYHVSLAEVPATALTWGATIDTAQGEEVITVTTATRELTVLNDDSTITQLEWRGRNGIIHVIDHPLLPVSASQSIYQYARANPDYSILADLIENANLVDALNGPGPRTIFAPNNAAFASLQGRGWDDFANDQARVRNLLLYHLVDGMVFGEELRRRDDIQSVQGSNIDIAVVEIMEGKEHGTDEFQIFLNLDSEVTITDDLVKNGLFHTIDRVLVPPITEDPTIAELLTSQGLTVFEAAARRTGLWDILNNPTETLTAFAAVDAGFDPEFTTILNDYNYYLHLDRAMRYQVAGWQALWTNELTPNLEMPSLDDGAILTVTQGHPQRPLIINFDSIVQIPDLIASNGAMQVVDRVIVPPFMEVNVVDVIARQPFQHSTLVYLLVLTGLIPDLSGKGPYTIFAPTNAAFQQLLFNAGILVGTDWTSNIDTMREILSYHVVPAVVYEEELIHDSQFKTLQGGSITVVNTALLPEPHVEPAGVVTEAAEVEKATPGGRRRHLSQVPGPPLPDPGEILLDGRARILASDQFGFNGVVHSIDSVLIPVWNDYRPNVAPESSTVDQYCLQWGQFENLCCPLEPNSEVVKQEDAEWYCDYIVVP